VYDAGAYFQEKRVRLIDIGALSGAKAVMMQSDRALAKSLASEFRCRRMNPETRAAANAVKGVGSIGHDCEAKERQELRVEGAGGREIPHGDERVGDAINLHARTSCGGTTRDDFRLFIQAQYDRKRYCDGPESGDKAGKHDLWCANPL
jgi:hypothetical protein